MADLVEPIIGIFLLVTVPAAVVASAWLLWGHRHTWRTVMVTDSERPVQSGHAIRRCYCGATKRN